MKILFVLPRMLSGGVERVTLNLAEALQADGVECCLALRRCEGELVDQARQCMEIHELAPKGLHHLVPGLVHLIRDWRPTHVVTAFADLGLLALLACRLSGRKVALVHGIHNTHALPNRRPGVRGLIRYGLDRVMAKVLYPRTDANICVSRGIKEEVRAMCPSALLRTHMIYNPVLKTSQTGSLQKIGNRDPGMAQRILALGRLTKQKGFDILIHAVALLPAELYWQLDIYGEGQMRSELERLISQLRLSSKVKLHGFTSHPQDVMRQADIFVLSSRYEGFGLVLVEAMAQGLQVVATDCRHGPREILEDGRLGLLVPPENPQLLAEALKKVLCAEHIVETSALLKSAHCFTVETAYLHWREIIESTLP